MLDHEGRSVNEATPATPVEVQGFSGIPEAGESFMVVEEEKLARQVSLQRVEKQRIQEVASLGPVSLEDLMARDARTGSKRTQFDLEGRCPRVCRSA